MRNIFEKDNKINYINYNDIIYDFDYIEKELGKIILINKKRFSKNIKFIKYLYEGFMSSDPIILEDYIIKYWKRELNKKEKELIINFIKQNKTNKFYSDIYCSLQILLDTIKEENYNPEKALYNIIISFPTYIPINEQLQNFLKETYENYCDEKLYSINCLISLFEIFEALCWESLKKVINIDYKLEFEEELKQKIVKYFEDNKNQEKKINKNNFTSALRKIISRYLIGIRQVGYFKNDIELILIIGREDLWNKDLIEDGNFENELFEILNREIK